MNVAGALAAAFAESGVRRIFGVPGGGGGLDIIAAAGEHGIDFVLTGGETAATIMAAVTGELTGVPGVVLTAAAPGALSAANGVGYAWLERAPVLILSDCPDPAQREFATHQSVDHQAFFTPITKASVVLEAESAADEIARLLALAAAHPAGPVHADLSAAVAMAGAPPRGPVIPSSDTDGSLADSAQIAAARALLAGARRPVLLVGLEAREESACAALRRWASELACPVLTTYKAKGVMPDGDPLVIGQVTGAVAEGACIEQADLIVFYGLDPVEMIPVPWAYRAPVLDLARVARERRYVDPTVEVVAPLAEAVEALRGINRRSDWTADRIVTLRNGMRARLASPASAGIAPQMLVEAARKAAPAGTRATVDAGAHMVSAMAFWDADEAHGVLKSNGLSTMGYALPAAIASALAEPERPVVALTGDGGLAMCLAELATAARLGLDITVVVFNDAALSLIDLKQRGRGLATSGVRYPRQDLASVARALGWRAWAVAEEVALEPALAKAMAAPGPALVDVAIDPGGYPEQFAALRG